MSVWQLRLEVYVIFSATSSDSSLIYFGGDYSHLWAYIFYILYIFSVGLMVVQFSRSRPLEVISGFVPKLIELPFENWPYKLLSTVPYGV